MPETKQTPVKSRRLEDMSTGRKGQFQFTLSQLSIPENYNPRTEFHGIPELAESIQLSGILSPLRVRKPSGTETIEVLDGERRFRAITFLADKGIDIGLIPCIAENKGTTELDRDLLPLIVNTGQELTLLEKARHYQRLISTHGIKPAELARRCQTTKQAVSDALTLVNEATPLLLSFVSGNKLSATTAIAIIRLAKETEEEQDSILMLAEQTAESAGANYITPKHLLREGLHPAAQQPEPPAKSPEKEDDQTDPKSTNDQPAPGTDNSQKKPFFTLYHINGAPPEQIANTKSYHESNRFALIDPPEGITLLHLLSAVSPDGVMHYGFRILTPAEVCPTEELPGTPTGFSDALPDEGFRLALDAALGELKLSHDQTDPIAEALQDAIWEYFPEEGNAKEPETIPFTSTSGEKESAHARLTGAGNTNRDGSGESKGEGGYSAPDKQMEKLNKLLEDIDKKGSGDEARTTTADFIIDFLQNTRSTPDMRKHLEGK